MVLDTARDDVIDVASGRAGRSIAEFLQRKIGIEIAPSTACRATDDINILAQSVGRFLNSRDLILPQISEGGPGVHRYPVGKAFKTRHTPLDRIGPRLLPPPP